VRVVATRKRGHKWKQARGIAIRYGVEPRQSGSYSKLESSTELTMKRSGAALFNFASHASSISPSSHAAMAEIPAAQCGGCAAPL
jgi:hypothetical protein